MKVLVIYDSVFGNTEKVARAIAEGLGKKAAVEMKRPAEVTVDGLAGFDLLVVGSPTRSFQATEATAALLKSLPAGCLQGRRVAAFDTRIDAKDIQQAAFRFMVKTGGYAAKKIADRLKKAGGVLAAAPEGFIVEATEGPMRSGELERAAAWGEELAAAC
jgi:flavodoxin